MARNPRHKGHEQDACCNGALQTPLPHFGLWGSACPLYLRGGVRL